MPVTDQGGNLIQDTSQSTLTLACRHLPSSVNAEPFQIIVLAMNRPQTLAKLLDSLQRADYCGHSVDLVISFDLASDMNLAVEVAESFVFKHGKTRVDEARARRGLAASWFSAWEPSSSISRAVIIEDDIEVYPIWYKLTQCLWLRYGKHIHLAGISLQQQTLIPLESMQSKSLKIQDQNVYIHISSCRFHRLLTSPNSLD